ncbi:GTPase Era [Egicoccus halophilus]|uniref:GTPase Era n=1 Tax=Egicoccus halophilus TaxID=1670830 RepID=UPI0010326BA5
MPEGHRSGLLALVGRPNVGKSTLLNQMVGEKVAIVTQVPGTTRNAIRGVVTRSDAQLVFLDTPGLAKPRTLLTRRLNELVRDTWAGVDAVCFLVDVADGIGRGDEFLAAELAGIRTPVVAVANKVDRVRDKASLLPRLARLEGLLGEGRSFADIVPVSAETGENVPALLDVLVSHLPEGPRLFGSGHVSDQPEAQLAAEILREKLIRDLQHELPHSVAVTVDEIRPSEEREDLLEVDAVIHVERDSQKGIVIGRKGANLKAAATAARQELEVLLGAKVFLTTHVTVAKEWQRDAKQLGRLGY